MSDNYPASTPPAAPDDEPVLAHGLIEAEPQPAPLNAGLLSAKWLLLVAALAVAGLLASGLLWQKLGNIQEELARRSTDSGAQAIEARTLARQAQEGMRELSARLAKIG